MKSYTKSEVATIVANVAGDFIDDCCEDNYGQLIVYVENVYDSEDFNEDDAIVYTNVFRQADGSFANCPDLSLVC